MHVVDHVLDVPMSTRFGTFRCGAFRIFDDRSNAEVEHLLLYLRLNERPCILRLNSACFTSGILGDLRCDCSWQFEFALDYMHRHGQGLLIYHMHHEGRSNGLLNKLRSFEAVSRNGRDGASAYGDLGLPPDAREFESAMLVLRYLDIRAVHLISNNPDKVGALRAAGVEVVERISVVSAEPRLGPYYDWKRTDFRHHL